MTAFAAASGTGAVYIFLAVQAATGAFTVGDLVLYTSLLFNLHRNLDSASSMITRGYRNLLDSSMFFDFLDMEPPLPTPAGGRRVQKPLSKGLELQNVRFAYPGAERPALDGVSFSIAPGETVALVGANGAGKTTVVKLLTRLYDPAGGRILLDGVDLREYDLDDLRQAFAVVLQDFTHYHLTVRENIGLGQVDQMGDRAQVALAAERGQARELIESLPQEFETVLGREFPEGVELSGGEWQKVAISRGFMREAEILILDEPTAALDAKAEQALYRRFAELVRGRTALFISHRLSTVRMADRIVVIEGGRMIEQGTHEALVAKGGRYARLFAMQAERYQE